MLIGKVEVGATSADRHAAIRKLVKHDWRDHPQVVSGLLSAAKGDADRAVRVDGIRHLAAYKVTEPRVLAALTEMTADNDSWIAKEAAEALTELMLETVEK